MSDNDNASNVLDSLLHPCVGIQNGSSQNVQK